MQLDYRHFVMKLERIAEIKPLPYQDLVVNYVKAYYIPEADLEQWVKVHEVKKSKKVHEVEGVSKKVDWAKYSN